MQKAAAGVMLAASMLCGAAHAQSSADLSLSDFSFALVDLDPNDGIDPSLTFLAPQLSQHSSATMIIDGGSAPVVRSDRGWQAFAPVSVSALSAQGSASASLSGLPGAGFALQSSNLLTSTGGTSTLSNEIATGYLGFVLSPMTAVTFSTRVLMSLGMDLSAPLQSGSTTATVRFDVNADIDGFGDTLSESATLNTTGGPRSHDAPLTLTLANALGSSTNNALQFGASVNALVVAAPVPEPSTWAMFIGGLALLLAQARMRMRKAAALRGA